MTDTSWFDQAGDANFQALVGDPQELFIGKVPGEESLNGMILGYLEGLRKNVPRVVTRSNGFHASEIGDMCYRNEEFKRLLPRASDQKDFEAELLLRFEIGHAVHKHWQGRILGKMRVLKGTWQCSQCMEKVDNTFMPSDPCKKCEWQMHAKLDERVRPSRVSVDCASKCSWPGGFFTPGRDCAHCERGGHWRFKETHFSNKEWELEGSYDGVILYNGAERLLEMKTKDVFAWDGLKAPEPKHVVQCQIYMFAAEIPHGVIVYINKNSGLIKEFPIEADHKLIARVKEQITDVRMSVKKGRLSNGVCGGPRERRAKECAFRDVCFLGLNDIESIKAHLAKAASAITEKA